MKITSIVVGTDLGEYSDRAIDLAVDLAKTFGAKLTLVHGFDPPPYVYGDMGTSLVDYLAPLEDTARQLLDKTLERASARWPRSSALLMRGAPWKQILRACEHESGDLIVIGTHGRTGISHALLGSVADKVVRLSQVPVLTVKGSGPS